MGPKVIGMNPRKYNGDQIRNVSESTGNESFLLNLGNLQLTQQSKHQELDNFLSYLKGSNLPKRKESFEKIDAGCNTQFSNRKKQSPSQVDAKACQNSSGTVRNYKEENTLPLSMMTDEQTPLLKPNYRGSPHLGMDELEHND